jgi:hypothetical protein
MDADDFMHPARLERQVRRLEERPELEGVGCGLLVMDRDGKPIGRRVLPPEHEAICGNPLQGFRIAHATFVGRAAWFRAHPYNAGNRGCEDWELWASSFRTSRFANLAELLYFYRELDSFTLRKYLRRKQDFAARLWTDSLLHRRNEPLDDVELESAREAIRAVEATPVPDLDAATVMDG